MGVGSSELEVQGTVRSFEDLVVWQKSQELAVVVYQTSRSFPDSELFGITNQLRRAASSISANIAEGFGRSGHKDKLHFMSIAYGSLLETKNFIYLCEKLGYTNHEVADEILKLCVQCEKLLSGFKRSLKSHDSTNS